MGKIFYLMGKSSCGKDTVFEEIINRKDLNLKRFVMYTTRPIRANETDGVQYFFVDELQLQKMQAAGKVIELRTYHTVHGIWHYFTADGDSINLQQQHYLALGTLESYQKIREYYGKDIVIPIYIEVKDQLRLERYIHRESKEPNPNFEEVCRRFLADQKDFSEEKIREAEIERRFHNDEELNICINEIAQYIKTCC